MRGGKWSAYFDSLTLALSQREGEFWYPALKFVPNSIEDDKGGRGISHSAGGPAKRKKRILESLSLGVEKVLADP